MKIIILSSIPEIPTTRLLSSALTQQKNYVSIYDPLSLSLIVNNSKSNSKNKSDVFLKQKPLARPDLVIPRLGWRTFSHGLRITQAFETMGCQILNSSQAIALAHDKLTALSILARSHLPVPKTFYFDPTQDSYEEFDFDYPIIVKTISGSQGKGVSLAKDHFSFRAWVELLRTEKVKFLIQEYIKGTEVRAMVFRGQLLASMERIAQKGEFRSNLHLGGRGKKVTLTTEEESLTLDAVRALGLDFAGVDFIKNKMGIKFLEINPFPGLGGISKITGMNLALTIAKMIA